MFKKDYKFFILLFFTAVVYFFALDKYPLIWIDEPWLAEPSFNLAKYGKFINLTFFNYYGKDLLDLQLPLFHLPLALVFKIFGLNIIAARGLSVILNLLTLVFVYYSAKLIYDNKNASLVAAAALALNPVFFQCAREIRPEAYVTFFTVLSFYFLLKAANTEKIFYFLACGASSALSFLAHPNGAFAVAASFLTIFFRNKKASFYYALTVFSFIACWAAYIAANLEIYRLQLITQFPTRVFFLKNFLSNFITEYRRWRYPSIFAPAFFGMASFFYLIYVNYVKKMRDKKQSLFISYTLIFLAAFLFLEKEKTFLYLNSIFPFLAIAVSGAYFDVAKKKKTLAVFLLSILLFMSGVFLPYKIHKYFSSNYYGVTAEIKKAVPEASCVIGRPTYWFGLAQDYNLRTYDLLDYYMKYYGYISKHKISYGEAVKLTGAGYIIFDNAWGRTYKDTQKQREDFFKNNCVLVKTFTDKFYGKANEDAFEPDNIKIYKIIPCKIR